ncbi:MAG: hypothetical protein FWD00_04260, partial [Clostridiales bacterium]|nr:hypothetical protein [Clostridiales bacterium]
LVILNADLDDIATSIPFEVNPNNPNEIRVDMVHLGASEAISFTGSSSVISVSMTGGVMELDGSSADMRFEIDGAALSHEGIQVDGSYVSGSTVTYFNRNITIVDANSDDFVQASILGTFASGTLYFNRAPFMIFRDGETITPSASLPLDRLVPYNIVMHDGVTQAEVVLLHDNTLRITLDGRVTSNFDDYRTPALYSQGQREWIVDTDGTIIEQGAGVEVRTIDNIHFFATESRQYMRPDGFANVTRININTQDGILQDIINRLPDRPTTPDRPGNGGGNGGGYTPERERERPELERPEEEEPYEILDEEVPLDEILFGNVAFDVPETPIYDGIIPHDSVIPQTSATDNRNLYIFMLVLSLSVFAILPKRRQSKQAISFSRHMN